jgi:DNA-binding PadR family transcriptional regulator
MSLQEFSGALPYRFSTPGDGVERSLQVLPPDCRAALKEVILPQLCTGLKFRDTVRITISEVRAKRTSGGQGMNLQKQIGESFIVCTRFGQQMGPVVLLNLEPTELDRNIKGGGLNSAKFRREVEDVCDGIAKTHPHAFLLPAEQQRIRDTVPSTRLGQPPGIRANGAEDPGEDLSSATRRPNAPIDESVLRFACPFEDKRWNPKEKMTLQLCLLAFAAARYGRVEVSSAALRAAFAEEVESKVTPQTLYHSLSVLAREGYFEPTGMDRGSSVGRKSTMVAVTEKGRAKVLTLLSKEATDPITVDVRLIKRTTGGNAKDKVEEVEFSDDLKAVAELRLKVGTLKAEVAEAEASLGEKMKLLSSLRDELNRKIQNLQE